MAISKNINIGDTFGKWTVLRRSGSTNSGEILWLCACACGTNRPVRGYCLRRGYTNSCGRCSSITHGDTVGRKITTEFHTWAAMMNRCYNPNNRSFKHYGGRGIFVCDRWHAFVNFLNDMGRKPSPEFSIERLNGNGPYSPDNCIWGTRLQQARNKPSYNRWITANGETHVLAEWAEILNVPASALYSRVYRNMSDHDIINKPFRTASFGKRN